ncbi:MAG: hypothetical protein Q9220_003161 [cf. Caloplaca sp. 1 TL-2023]
MNPAMRSQYHNIHHQNAPPSARRPGIAPAVPNAAAQQEARNRERKAQEAHQAQEREMAQRRAHKPSDKNMPEGIDEFVIGDGVQQYKRMRDIEQRLDAMMMRKRLDMQDTRHNVTKRYKTMKIWISNTFENQPWQAKGSDTMYDFGESSDGVYRMKIEGRLLDDEEDELSDNDEDDDDSDKKEEGEKDIDSMDHDGPPKPPKSTKFPNAQPRTKLSHFFKAITVEMDRNRSNSIDSAPAPIEWKKPILPPNAVVLPPSADFDSLEFERRTDGPINCTVNLFRDESPERFLLSDPLAELLDSKIEDRRTIYLGIYDYIKAMNLQQDDEKRAVQCDDLLRKVCSPYL